MPAALTAVAEKREAREIPGFSFYDLNPAEAPPVRKREKSMRGAGRLPVLCRAPQPPGMYTALGSIFPLAADKLPLLPCSRLCEAGPALFILIARGYRNHRGYTIPRFHFPPATAKFPLPVPGLLS